MRYESMRVWKYESMRASFGNLVVLKSASERIQEQSSEKSSDPKE